MYMHIRICMYCIYLYASCIIMILLITKLMMVVVVVVVGVMLTIIVIILADGQAQEAPDALGLGGLPLAQTGLTSLRLCNVM